MLAIYIFSYGRSGPFIWVLITVKTRVFRENENTLSVEDCEMLVMFEKLPVNFRKS